MYMDYRLKPHTKYLASYWFCLDQWWIQHFPPIDQLPLDFQFPVEPPPDKGRPAVLSSPLCQASHMLFCQLDRTAKFTFIQLNWKLFFFNLVIKVLKVTWPTRQWTCFSHKYHNVDYLEILIRVREFEYFGPKKGDVN